MACTGTHNFTNVSNTGIHPATQLNPLVPVKVCLLYVSRILWKLLLMMRLRTFRGLAAMLGTCTAKQPRSNMQELSTSQSIAPTACTAHKCSCSSTLAVCLTSGLRMQDTWAQYCAHNSAPASPVPSLPPFLLRYLRPMHAQLEQ